MKDLNEATLIITALISAGTSGLVTLSVEWLAKPRLEARKEKILAEKRAEAEILRQLLHIRENSIRLAKYPSMKGINSSQQGKLRKNFEEFVGRIRDGVDVLDRAFAELAPGLDTGLYALLTGYIGLVNGILESDETYRRKFYHLVHATLAVEDAYGKRFPPFHRKKRIAEAEYALRNPPRTVGQEEVITS